VRLNARVARTNTAALLLALSLASPVAARSGDTRSTVGTVNTLTVRIDNFGSVNQNYYRGAQPEGRDYADLAALGIKTVINLTSDDSQANEKAMVAGANMKYFEIPMTTHEPPTSAELAKFMSIVNDPANQPVYVHCVGGRHRTGVMTAAYRMTDDGWTADEAFKEMKQYKFGADFLHPEFKQFVYGYRAEPALAVASSRVVATTQVPGAISARR
jgi:tyrosine-protein phosphatase SIW14